MCRARILVADDETDIRNILRRLLLSEGFCVCEAGNGIEALAAASGIPCRIYVPAAAPHGKLVQIAISGADIRTIPGTRQAVTEAALAATGESFYASHNWQPFFIEGTKTLAFELWEQLGFRVPDNILVPTGYGSNILGLERGFDELEKSGEIAARPRFFAVQAANCAAFAAAWAAGENRFVPIAARPTIADGIATPKPGRVAEVLRALRRSKGGVVAVAEEEITAALAALGRLGFFVEPTAATAGAALTRLLNDGTIGAEAGEPAETGAGAAAWAGTEAVGAVSDRAVSDKAVTDGAVPKEAVPKEAVPDGAAPDGAAPDSAVPARPVPDSPAPGTAP